MRQFATKALYTMGEGVYPNESEFDLEEWKKNNWGSEENYERLLSVKQRYDPANLLNCYHCVGSERTEMNVKDSSLHFEAYRNHNNVDGDHWNEL